MKAKKIVFTSGKGGVGKSTLSAATAKILSEDNKRILMVDCDIGLRSLDIILGVNNVVYDWGDVLSGICDISSATVHTKSADLLAAPLGKAFTTVTQMNDMLSEVSESYDFIMLDSPAGIGSGFSLAVGCADFALLITTPDEVCVRSARSARRILESENITTRMIINRFSAKQVKKDNYLNIDDTIDAVGAQLIGVIPEDEIFAAAMHKGCDFPLDLPASAALVRTIKRIYGHNIPLEL